MRAELLDWRFPPPPKPMENPALESLEVFRRLSGPGLQLLHAGVQRLHLPRHTQALYKGQAISGAYFVLSGRLRVFSLSPEGSEASLYFIDPGETCIFALNSLFNDLSYPAWVEAESDTTLALVPGPLFRRLFQQEPGIQDMTVRALSTLVFRLMRELEDVHAYKLEQRLANLLLLRANTQGEIAMTQEQIAHHLGSTREVIARLLRGMVAARLLQTRRGRIQLLDRNGLSRLLGQPAG